LNENYIRPTLVTFTDATVSECGGATESVGPFYCPADQKMYIDLDFFHQLKSEFGAKGDLESAISATTAVGDDTIQKRSMGYSVPDSFTHGTAAQRTYWFRKGMETGDIRQGDTFNEPGLR